MEDTAQKSPTAELRVSMYRSKTGLGLPSSGSFGGWFSCLRNDPEDGAVVNVGYLILNDQATKLDDTS